MVKGRENLGFGYVYNNIFNVVYYFALGLGSYYCDGSNLLSLPWAWMWESFWCERWALDGTNNCWISIVKWRHSTTWAVLWSGCVVWRQGETRYVDVIKARGRSERGGRCCCVTSRKLTGVARGYLTLHDVTAAHGRGSRDQRLWCDVISAKS